MSRHVVLTESSLSPHPRKGREGNREGTPPRPNLSTHHAQRLRRLDLDVNDTEIRQLAHAINELRPDWPIASLTTWLRNNLVNRPFQHAAVAMVWVALDRKADGSYVTQKPSRVLEAGPWWRAAAAGDIGEQATRHPREREACPVCGGWCAGPCVRDQYGTDRDVDPGVPPVEVANPNLAARLAKIGEH